ncbi:Enterochelin esterase [Cyclonatronum proteinivorum]|uniref:Enterochelin esterase n=1 Tax=Cyclonatronum proteinivorum TaxID=1457365 RepID=A0A345UFW6_9BACT|nr:alpha/beta hydrolase-fold protein [Cyclonatronum proteinivorum]AXI99367.1 Enterochelin esterase [Cyclonatronum proteinivorum]
MMITSPALFVSFSLLLVLTACVPSGDQNEQDPDISGFSATEIAAQDDPTIPVPFTGQIVRFSLTSEFVDARLMDVWLPDSYDGQNPHRVLYMHDGQMLFDATHTWNNQEWQVDEVSGSLIAEGQVAPFIVVGIWNNGDYRHAEYFPEGAVAYLPESAKAELEARHQGVPRADGYLRFLTNELKPFIDQRFTVKPEREATFIAGSSMGGLISMYALMQYPDIFGGAAALSTHWIGLSEQNEAFPEAFRSYISGRLHLLTNHALYFDFGTVGLDALYIPHQAAVDSLLGAKAPEGLRHVSRRFEGAGHNETDWAARLHEPLLFLMRDDHSP